MADGVNINVDSPEITAPVSVELSGTSIVESITNGLNQFVDNLKKGSDEGLFGKTTPININHSKEFWRNVVVPKKCKLDGNLHARTNFLLKT